MKPQRTFEIHRLKHGDVANFKDLIKIFKDVFENEEPTLEDIRLSELLCKPDFMVFVVKQNDKVVGGLTIYILHRYFGTKPVAYIYDVGVSPDFQGKGLGKSLISEVCKYCKENGFEDAYVEAESDDSDAVNFYKKTKFSSEINSIHFTYTFDNKN